uniref:SJCHGC02198 protein n=1 Tax=Haemonchus contortus TaxID=6289 RepID=W6NT46_HAECO
MPYRSILCPSAPDQRSSAKAFLGRRLRTDLDLMLPQEDVAGGGRDVKMKAQFTQRHGALRRKFELNDTVFAKDSRGTKQSWSLGVIVRLLETQLTSFLVEICYGPDTWTSCDLEATQLQQQLQTLFLMYSIYHSSVVGARRLRPIHHDDRNAIDDRNADSCRTPIGPNTIQLKRGGVVGYC